MCIAYRGFFFRLVKADGQTAYAFSFSPPFFGGCWIFFVSSLVSCVRKKHDARKERQ